MAAKRLAGEFKGEALQRREYVGSAAVTCDSASGRGGVTMRAGNARCATQRQAATGAGECCTLARGPVYSHGAAPVSPISTQAG